MPIVLGTTIVSDAILLVIRMSHLSAEQQVSPYQCVHLSYHTRSIELTRIVEGGQTFTVCSVCIAPSHYQVPQLLNLLLGVGDD